MQETLLQQGLDITLFGMGIVFSFLLLLVVGTTLMSRLITRFFPESEPAAIAAPSSASGDVRLQAVIKAAIDQHRSKRR